MMFVTLLWAFTGMKEEIIAALFPIEMIHQRDVMRFVKRVLPAMGRQLRGEIPPLDASLLTGLADAQEFMHDPRFERVTCVVDGTETKVTRSRKEDQSKQEYSVKKKQTALCWTILTLLNGVIVWLSQPSWITMIKLLGTSTNFEKSL